MKRLFILLSILIIISCEKNKISDSLPDITQVGKNTIGFTMDGQVWLPYYTCSLNGDPCGKIQARYGTSYGGPPNSIAFSFTKRKNGKFQNLQISEPQNFKGTITTTGNKIDSISVSFITDGGVEFSTILPGSNFNITTLDFANQVISGTFNFNLGEYNNTSTKIQLNDGRFDLKINACICDK